MVTRGTKIVLLVLWRGFAMQERKNMGIMVAAIVVIIVVIMAAFAYVATTDNSGTGSVIITDDRGENVTVPKYPQRIVSLGSSFTEVLFALGAGDQVVGVDQNSKYPAEALNKTNVGGGYTVNVEAITALNPDCIVIWSFATGAVNTLEGLDLPVLAFYPRSIADVMSVIERLGVATGNEDTADDLVSGMQAVMDEVADKVKDLTDEEKPKVYFELRSGKSVGPGTFTHELITLAGGINIYANATTSYPEPSAEWVINENPNIIIVEDQSTVANEDFATRPGWSVVDAVINDQIFRINGDIVSSNPRVVDALMQFAMWLHPDLFT